MIDEKSEEVLGRLTPLHSRCIEGALGFPPKLWRFGDAADVDAETGVDAITIAEPCFERPAWRGIDRDEVASDRTRVKLKLFIQALVRGRKDREIRGAEILSGHRNHAQRLAAHGLCGEMEERNVLAVDAALGRICGARPSRFGDVDNVRMRFLGKDRDAPEPLEEARARRSFTKREISHIDPIGAPERLSAALARLEVFAECMNRHRPPIPIAAKIEHDMTAEFEEDDPVFVCAIDEFEFGVEIRDALEIDGVAPGNRLARAMPREIDPEAMEKIEGIARTIATPILPAPAIGRAKQLKCLLKQILSGKGGGFFDAEEITLFRLLAIERLA